MSDYMEYYEFYKKHLDELWERSLPDKTSDMQKELDLLRAENARGNLS